MGILWENSFGVFLLLTIFLGGGAAWLSGRAIAMTWRPVWQVVLYMVLLAAVVRFFSYALFEGTLLTLQYYVVDLAFLLVFAGLGYRVTRAGQMTTQYSWLYERAGPLSWRKKAGTAGQA